MEANTYRAHRRLHHERPGSTTAWRKLRAQVLARDHYQCQRPGCGARDQLEVHHVRPVSAGGTDTPENLLTLCTTHHPRGAPPYGGMQAA